MSGSIPPSIPVVQASAAPCPTPGPGPATADTLLDLVPVPVSDPAYAALTTSQRLRVEVGADGKPSVVVVDESPAPKLLGDPIGERVFKPVEEPLTEYERSHAPSFAIEHAMTAAPVVRGATGEKRRFVLNLEFQFRADDMLYCVTRHVGSAPNGAEDHYAYHLWREQHGYLEPVRLGKTLRQRLLTARGVVNGWTTDNIDFHDLEPEGRHDKRLTIMIIRGPSGTEVTQQTFVSLGTTQLTDSEWLDTWYRVLGNAQTVAHATKFEESRYFTL